LRLIRAIITIFQSTPTNLVIQLRLLPRPLLLLPPLEVQERAPLEVLLPLLPPPPPLLLLLPLQRVVVQEGSVPQVHWEARLQLSKHWQLLDFWALGLLLRSLVVQERVVLLHSWQATELPVHWAHWVVSRERSQGLREHRVRRVLQGNLVHPQNPVRKANRANPNPAKRAAVSPVSRVVAANRVRWESICRVLHLRRLRRRNL